MQELIELIKPLSCITDSNASSSVVAIMLSWWLLPLFNQIAKVQIHTQDLFSYHNLMALVGITTMLSVGSGAYPAYLLSGIRATRAFQGGKLPGSGINLVRRALIVMQFMITAFMIISTIVVYRQLHHFRNMDLGFDRQGIISVRLYGDLWVDAIQKKEVLDEMQDSVR